MPLDPPEGRYLPPEDLSQSEESSCDEGDTPTARAITASILLTQPTIPAQSSHHASQVLGQYFPPHGISQAQAVSTHPVVPHIQVAGAYVPPQGFVLTPATEQATIPPRNYVVPRVALSATVTPTSQPFTAPAPTSVDHASQALQKLQLENQEQVAKNKAMQAELAQLKAAATTSSASSSEAPTTSAADNLVLGGNVAIYRRAARRYAIMRCPWVPISVFTGRASDLDPNGVMRYKDDHHWKLGWTAEIYTEETDFSEECWVGLRNHESTRKYVREQINAGWASAMNTTKEHRDRIFRDLAESVREKLLAGQYNDPEVEYLLKGKGDSYLKLCPLMYAEGRFGKVRDLFKREAATKFARQILFGAQALLQDSQCVPPDNCFAVTHEITAATVGLIALSFIGIFYLASPDKVFNEIGKITKWRYADTHIWLSETIAKAIHKGNSRILAYWNANVFGWILNAAVPPQVQTVAGSNPSNADWDAAQLQAFENGHDAEFESDAEADTNATPDSHSEGAGMMLGIEITAATHTHGSVAPPMAPLLAPPGLTVPCPAAHPVGPPAAPPAACPSAHPIALLVARSATSPAARPTARPAAHPAAPPAARPCFMTPPVVPLTVLPTAPHLIVPPMVPLASLPASLSALTSPDEIIPAMALLLALAGSMDSVTPLEEPALVPKSGLKRKTKNKKAVVEHSKSGAAILEDNEHIPRAMGRITTSGSILSSQIALAHNLILMLAPMVTDQPVSQAHLGAISGSISNLRHPEHAPDSPAMLQQAARRSTRSRPSGNSGMTK